MTMRPENITPLMKVEEKNLDQEVVGFSVLIGTRPLKSAALDDK